MGRAAELVAGGLDGCTRGDGWGEGGLFDRLGRGTDKLAGQLDYLRLGGS